MAENSSHRTDRLDTCVFCTRPPSIRNFPASDCAACASCNTWPLIRVASLLLLSLLTATFSGCAASEVTRRPAPATDRPAAVQGRAWEAVLFTPAVTAAIDRHRIDPANEAWASRNDARLSYQPQAPQLASAQWPEPDRPALSDRRYLFLPDRPDLLLYYDQERGDWRRYHHYPFYRY